jgi:hypothetical protein
MPSRGSSAVSIARKFPGERIGVTAMRIRIRKAREQVVG